MAPQSTPNGWKRTQIRGLTASSEELIQKSRTKPARSSIQVRLSFFYPSKITSGTALSTIGMIFNILST